jgi:hypothetical protein
MAWYGDGMAKHTLFSTLATAPLGPERDIVYGDSGDDVAELQNRLIALGLEIAEEELRQKRYGDATRAAAEQLRENAIKNPVLAALVKSLLSHLFGIDMEEVLNPAESRGERQPNRNYHYSKEYELDALTAGTWGQGPAAAVSLAEKLVGQHEVGNNGGAIVRLVCDGKEGLPWCGGFVHYVMSKTISPQLFPQSDYLRARSYADEAGKYGAFRDASAGYQTKVGDVIVFGRGNGNGQGHVGIVSAISADGKVSYIAGNDADAVSVRSFDAKNPPQSLLGYADTRALAKAKNIALEVDSVPAASAASQLVARAHDDRAFARG